MSYSITIDNANEGSGQGEVRCICRFNLNVYLEIKQYRFSFYVEFKREHDIIRFDDFFHVSCRGALWYEGM